MPEEVAENRTPCRCLCTAEAFGFGPASKLLALLRHVPRDRLAELSFLGEGCAHELCSTGPFDRVIQASPVDGSRAGPLHGELERHDVLISAMEFQPLAAARAMGLRTIVFDSLFWMWPRSPCDFDDVDLYLCQNFVGVSARRAAWADGHRIVVVPPLTESIHTAWSEGQRVLLNFGGMDNPHASRTEILNYATSILRVVAQEVASPPRPLDVFGRSWVMEELAREFPSSNIRFATLSPARFIRQLREARCLITSPGLEVVYEAFTLGVPTFLLPAQNNSQAFQARILESEVPTLHPAQWHELMDTRLLTDFHGPEQMIREALHCAGRLSRDRAAQGKLAVMVRDFIARDERRARRQCQDQSAFLERMRRGCDISTTDDLRSLLTGFLANTGQACSSIRAIANPDSPRTA